ncbi:MAG: hypothetical protein GEU82_03425 [Luteitalea sp.]|nr:hypothetical protein [Luteitalea sp.]
MSLYQDSSGGNNWRSSVHVNREGRVPIRFNGYRLESPEELVEGRRASPAIEVAYEGGAVAAAVRHFWQNFPKALDGDRAGLTIRLFPEQWDDLHELQGGESKTHTASLAFDGPFPEALSSVLEPAVLSCEPEWYERCQAVPLLTPAQASRAPDYEGLVNAAIEGDDTFNAKRERIDEYGWRNFGDIYADHEAVGHQGERPLVSHYNNQYDAIAGFAIQFMRSGDLRWFSAMEDLALHVTDIDVYHTDEDKSAFNHGLFWHTAHYVDAGRSTHRTYPRAPGVSGGGPSNEHDYSTGLLLHHLLTGDERSRAGVVELVNWVMAMDDGRRTVFRFLSRADTGLASSTVSPTYHGPGRGAGNSIATLLNGFRLTGDRRFLDKAESLVRRCIHPADDLQGNGLLDAERRWSYTVFLQVLGKYLQAKTVLGEIDSHYAYARASLLHYGRWMAVNEYPYLERPDLLEYPNETWAAQDIRKAEIFATVARYTAGGERELMLERSRFFFDRSISTLTAHDTRTLARPIAILLSSGHDIAKLQSADSTIDDGSPAIELRPPAVFVPQKIEAVRNFLLLSAFAALMLVALVSYIVARYLR